MAQSIHPYATIQAELQAEQNVPTAPPPAYMQTESLITAQPSTGGGPSVSNMQMPNFVTTYANPNPPVGPKSTQMRCPQCKCLIKSEVRHRSTWKTHIACLLLCCTGCCCLPYCMDTCRNANHFCPMCGAFLGTYAS
uniref:Lipopolysaccharide-induced tumor necrosis factor-alpha factor n=1 Tax=Ceratitis capitata TaxID=7213 RepID=W8CB75_CERCA